MTMIEKGEAMIADLKLKRLEAEREEAVAILQGLTDQRDQTDLVQLCRDAELEVDCEYEQRLKAEKELRVFRWYQEGQNWICVVKYRVMARLCLYPGFSCPECGHESASKWTATRYHYRQDMCVVSALCMEWQNLTTAQKEVEKYLAENDDPS